MTEGKNIIGSMLNDWESAGYKRYPKSGLSHEDFIVQKCFKDERGKRYFITVLVYDPQGTPRQDGWGFQPEVQFSKGRFPTLNLTILDHDIASVEEVADHVWRSIGEPYYELWGEDE